MGAGNSVNTRRISLDNTIALRPSLSANVEKSIEDEPSVMDIRNFKAVENIGDFSSGVKTIEIPNESIELSYWAHRVEDLKKEHQMINSILEAEYIKTLEDTNELCPQQVVTQEMLQSIKPCYDWRSKIMQCYQDNPRHPLVCSGLVQAFSKCVASCKSQRG